MVAWSRSLPKSQMSLKAFGKLTTDDALHLCSGIQLEWTPFEKINSSLDKLLGMFLIRYCRCVYLSGGCMGGCESKNRHHKDMY